MPLTRRTFIQSGAATAAMAGFPAMVPASVLGQFSRSKRINVGAIAANAMLARSQCAKYVFMT